MSEIVRYTLNAPLASGETITLSYPAGTTASSFSPIGHSVFVRERMSFYYAAADDFDLSFGASSITLTWDGPTLARGSNLSIELYDAVDEGDDIRIDLGDGAGAVALDDRLKALPLNVKNFGAKGDGATNDGPAIDAMLGNGRRIIIPPGTYLVGSTIGGSNLSDVTIEIMPGAIIKKASTLAGKLFQFNNSQRIRITGGGKIDDSEAPNSGVGQANDAVYFAGCEDIEVDHIWFYSGDDAATAGGDSQVFFSGSSGKIHDCRFDAAWDLAVYLSGPNPTSSGTFTQTEVYSNRFVGCAGACGAKRGFEGLNFYGNFVEGGGNGVFAGETETGNTNGQRGRVYGNTFRNLTGIPIIFRVAQGWLAENNHIINCTAASLIAFQGAERCTARDNNIWIDTAVYTSPSTQAAIRLQSRTQDSTSFHSTYNTVEGNRITNVYAGIREDDSSQNFNRYLDNEVTGHTADTATYGINRQGVRSIIRNEYRNEIRDDVTTHALSQAVTEQVVGRKTGAGPVNVYTIAVPSSRSCVVTVQATLNNSGVAAGGGLVTAIFGRQSGGNVRLVGSVQGTIESSEFTTATVNFVADTASQAIRVQIEGQSGISVDYALLITYQLLATNA